MRVDDVLRISIPVFCVMGIGAALRKRGVITETHRDFCNDLTYYLALPLLIFIELATQPLRALINPPLVIATLSAIAVITILYGLIAHVCRFRGGFGAAFVFGTFWANVSYMGFPLMVNAFGAERGLALAAVVNACAMPVFVALGFGCIAVFDRSRHQGFAANLLSTVINPVVISAVCGLAASGGIELARAARWSLIDAGWIRDIGSIIRSFCTLIGSMGLPLALIALGASIRLDTLTVPRWPLIATAAGKLVVLPCLTMLIMDRFFPGVERDVRAAAILLMGTPNAVASYVVARRLHVADDFVSSLLVTTTAASTITIPVWLFFV